MRANTAPLRAVDGTPEQQATAEQALLDHVFFAISDPIRRAILDRLGEEALLVSEIAAPFEVSLQAISRHIQVLVRAGLVQQARSGRVSRCSLDVAPIFAAAVWINRYSKYWQAQFDTLAGWLEVIERRRKPPAKRAKVTRKRSKA